MASEVQFHAVEAHGSASLPLSYLRHEDPSKGGHELLPGDASSASRGR